MKTFFSIVQILGRFFHESGSDKQLGDMLLDTIENFVARTDNTLDDKLLLPAIKALRIAFDIPDNDEQPNLEVIKNEA